jgi:hypothetical protein
MHVTVSDHLLVKTQSCRQWLTFIYVSRYMWLQPPKDRQGNLPSRINFSHNPSALQGAYWDSSLKQVTAIYFHITSHLSPIIILTFLIRCYRPIINTVSKELLNKTWTDIICTRWSLEKQKKTFIVVYFMASQHYPTGEVKEVNDRLQSDYMILAQDWILITPNPLSLFQRYFTPTLHNLNYWWRS